nr:MAG TPA_asm: hypothetical protein [Caudoviricetes sp.]
MPHQHLSRKEKDKEMRVREYFPSIEEKQCF